MTIKEHNPQRTEHDILYAFLGELAQAIDDRPTNIMGMSRLGLNVLGTAMEYIKAEHTDKPWDAKDLAQHLADKIKAAQHQPPPMRGRDSFDRL